MVQWLVQELDCVLHYFWFLFMENNQVCVIYYLTYMPEQLIVDNASTYKITVAQIIDSRVTIYV